MGSTEHAPEGSDVSNLAELLAGAAAAAPDKTALVEAATGRRVTWSALDEEVTRVSGGLSAAGLVAGYRVMIAVGNRIPFVTGYLGALRSGLVAVPVNPRSATGELVRMIADCGARLVIADAETVIGVRAAVAGLQDALEGADEELRARSVVPRVVVVDVPALPGETTYDDLLGDAAVNPSGHVPAPEDPEALAAILYTSGTSGRPRGAMLSHRALLANIEQVAAVDPPITRTDDVVLGVLPMFHVYGLNAVLGQVLRQRATLVLLAGFDPQQALDVVTEEAVTVLPVAPPVFGAWLRVPHVGERLRGVRLVLSGSAPLSTEVVAAFTDLTGLPVHQGYGLTEAAPVVTSTLCSAAPKPGSVGAALPGIHLRVVAEDGRPVEGGDPGEVHISGDNLFSGYWPGGVDGPGPDGWYATGDVGFLDPDGDLFLVDRIRDLVIVSGFNVYPQEVEAVLAEVDGVAEAAVVGTPDEETGEAVVAYLRPVPDLGRSEGELVEEVREHCRGRLARFKQPTVLHVVDELPHTVTGKVAKGQLREAGRARHAGLLE